MTGSATMTNLGNVSIATTIAANSIALGTDTVGNYVSTIAGTSNEIEVSGSGSETATVTIGLPNDVTIGQDLSVTRDVAITRNLTVGGNTTLGNQSSDTVSIPGNLTITGDLTVNGTNTILNTATLEVEDTLILTGTAGTEPSTGGFGIETRLFTGTSVPSGAASNVTGTHSLVYNFATDQWEADGSLVLSEATLGTAKVENTDFGSGKDLVFAAGSGLSEAVTGLSGNTFTVTYTNTDKGSSQLFYKTFTTDAGSNVVASANNDTIDFEGGTGLTTTGSADKVSIKLDDTSVTAGSYGSGTAIPTFTVDAQGRLTQAGTVSVDTYSGWNLTVAGQDRGNISENENVSFVGGTAIDATYSATNNVITFNHADTSSVSDVDNSGTNFIQDMTFDTFGHVQSVTSAGFSLGNGQLTMNTSGSGISGSQTFTANATGNSIFTVTLNSDTGSNADTVALRDTNGNIAANFFKTDDANNISSGSVTKLFAESGNDGFIRYAQPAAVRQFINVADGATNTTNPNNATITVSAGTSLSGGGSFTTDQSSNGTITINHADTSSQGSVNNSGRTYIQDITLDTHGHVTAINSATETAVSDTGTPAITSNGSSPSLNSGISEAEIRSLIGAGTSSFSGAYADLSGKPTIPTNNNQLTNGAGYSTFTSNQGLNTNDNVRFDGLRVGDLTSAPANTIQCTGDIVAFASSDERLKDNLSPISNSLEKVGQLKGYEFDWNDKQEVYTGHDVGVLAQEVEKVVPEIVETREHDGYKAVKYEKLVPLLINAINDLKAEIEELKDINKKV